MHTYIHRPGRQLIGQLNNEISRKDWAGCVDACFRLLYGLPEQTQRELAILMVRRYMPIFHHHWPEEGWPQDILEQPLQWFTQHGREVPEGPDNLNPADAAFVFCFDAILNAIARQTDTVIVTSSYLCAINEAINASKTNAWMLDDPESVSSWQRQGYFPGRSADENSAAMAVTESEWRVVLDWLSDKKCSELFSTPDEDEVEAGLARWKETEMSLIQA